MSSDFFSGMMFWLRGWAMIFSRKSLMALAVMPFVISVLATGALVYLLWTHLGSWTQMFLLWVSSSHAWIGTVLHYPLLAAGAILIFMSSIYVVYVFQALVAVPFNSMLAARTLKQLGKSVDEERLRREWVIHTVRMIAINVVKAVFLLSVGVVFFIFSFIPVLNFVALGGTLLILAGDCADYSFEVLRFGMRRRLGYLLRHRMQWLGMATGLGLTLLVPGLTFLVIPGAVVGAAILVKAEE